MSSTAIEWTDATWNPITGCSKVSPGCKHCYAERTAKRLAAMGVSGYHPDAPFAVRFQPDRLDAPRRWKKPRRIFVNSMSDLFHPQVTRKWLDRIFKVMRETPRHLYQVLTKRPPQMLGYISVGDSTRWPENVWLGVSVETQITADIRIPSLAATGERWIRRRFVSYEPALEAIDLWPHLRGGGISWVIVGGESGPGARRFDCEWPLTTIEQCAAADVACFVKQLGASPYLNGERLRLKSRKGGDPAEWPAGLDVREEPEEFRMWPRIAKGRRR